MRKLWGSCRRTEPPTPPSTRGPTLWTRPAEDKPEEGWTHGRRPRKRCRYSSRRGRRCRSETAKSWEDLPRRRLEETGHMIKQSSLAFTSRRRPPVSAVTKFKQETSWRQLTQLHVGARGSVKNSRIWWTASCDLAASLQPPPPRHTSCSVDHI